MDELEKSLKEIEIKNKKSSIVGTLVILAFLGIFALIYLNNIKVKKLKSSHELEIKEVIAVKDNLEEQNAVSLRIIENEKLKSDSLKAELERVKLQLSSIKRITTTNSVVQNKIINLQENLKSISAFTRDTIIVRYYQRNADGRTIVDVAESIENPYYYLHFRDVYDDDGSKKVNTFYYGENVKKEYVEILYNGLIKNGIALDRKQFKSAKGFEWKKNAIEIGFEKPTSKTDENADIFIRVYSFRPNQQLKQRIGNGLEAKGYQVTIYPDWDSKPSFFSNTPTVLYYNKANKSKAEEIARILERLTRFKFSTLQGNGYGVTDSEKSSLFIIHYNGS
jgi:hypothetical protein